MNNFNSLKNNMIATKIEYKSSNFNFDVCCCCNCCFTKEQNYSFFDVD